MEDIVKLSQGEKSALYSYRGHQVHYWVAPKGVLSLGLEEYVFTEAFNELPGAENAGGGWRCPETLAALAGPDGLQGEAVFIRFCEDNIPRYQLLTQRQAVLEQVIGSLGVIISRKKFDPVRRVYFVCRWDPMKRFIAPVTVFSSSYGGRNDGLILACADSRWQALVGVVNGLADQKATLEGIDDAAFAGLLACVRGVMEVAEKL